ncbi:MAG: 3-dehydroquinate synthase [Cryomorphaceae bacterium]|nr:3-dehydroquinate synthase [Cryomorphaceae bacterium]
MSSSTSISSQKRLEVILKSYDRIAILTDENVKAQCWHHFDILSPLSTLVLPIGESTKSVKYAEEVWFFLQSKELTRKSLLISVGGGVITDLGGFCASTYMRGIDFLHIPTTTLGMVDAAHGGKTGINANWGKNMIGTFQMPVDVLIFPEVLNSLSNRHFLSGVVEAFKTAVMFNKDLLDFLIAHPSVLQLREKTGWIFEAARTKQRVVKDDFRENNLRKFLNFGHTFGHAFEHFVGNDRFLQHGEAVAYGMLAEMQIAEYKGFFYDFWKNWVDENMPILPINKSHVDEIMYRIIRDKKNSNSLCTFVTPRAIGAGGVELKFTPKQTQNFLETFLPQTTPHEKP